MDITNERIIPLCFMSGLIIREEFKITSQVMTNKI